jgi:hypothetical protein
VNFHFDLRVDWRWSRGSIRIHWASWWLGWDIAEGIWATTFCLLISFSKVGLGIGFAVVVVGMVETMMMPAVEVVMNVTVLA